MQTLILQSNSASQLDLLLRLAKEMHIKAKLIEDDISAEKIAFAKLSETSFAKEWNSDEDAHWDKFLK